MTRFSIETASGCTRTCATCMRQTYPDRNRIRRWTDTCTQMPLHVIQRVLTELWEMGYRKPVSLNNYNEPLMDERLPTIARLVRNLGFQQVRTITNGDLMTPRIARALDGVMTYILISAYDVSEDRMAEIRGWFKTTHIAFASGLHRLSHWSPAASLEGVIEKLQMQPCFEPSAQFIVNHEGDCLLCCEEIVPHFGLGNVYRQPLADIWSGATRKRIIRTLRKPGGRLKYDYCKMCPCGRNRSRKLIVEEIEHGL